MQDIKLELHEGIGVAIIKVNRPQKRNAYRVKTVEEMYESIQSIESNYKIRCAVITGEGDTAFSSGGDINNELYFSQYEPENLKRFNDIGTDVV